jgi:hypothetical protein
MLVPAARLALSGNKVMDVIAAVDDHRLAATTMKEAVVFFSVHPLLLNDLLVDPA